ncbi:MAG: hypothetical protein R3248_13465 [Candidatus Promineifilaceae bacterium]|nr:hypothetical protein [Candidatus Promineifilaceae bacterium]
MALSLSTSLIVADNGGFAPITWWTADGGGGQSSGDSYRLNGTAGQPDAGAMAGGSYRLDGGLWEAGETAPAGVGPDVYLPFVTR